MGKEDMATAMELKRDVPDIKLRFDEKVVMWVVYLIFICLMNVRGAVQKYQITPPGPSSGEPALASLNSVYEILINPPSMYSREDFGK